jgi:hypothetical protein
MPWDQKAGLLDQQTDAEGICISQLMLIPRNLLLLLWVSLVPQ